MKCNNCGMELNDNVKICPRCGSRQVGNISNNNKKGKSNFGKIIISAITLFAVFFVFFGISKLSRKDKNIDFTDNISFEKNNLTLMKDSTLRLRDVDKKMFFSLDTPNGYADVKVTDEDDGNIDIVLERQQDGKRYLLKPKNEWNETKLYKVSVDNETKFSDESLYKFKSVVFNVKRKEVSYYKYNDNIKNIIENPNLQVEVGDIIIFKDENGQSQCRKIINKVNDQNQYDLPDLKEVFSDLNINKEFKVDFSLLDEDELDRIDRELAYNVSRSHLLDAFVMATYATDLNIDLQSNYEEIQENINKEVQDLSTADFRGQDISMIAETENDFLNNTLLDGLEIGWLLGKDGKKRKILNREVSVKHIKTNDGVQFDIELKKEVYNSEDAEKDKKGKKNKDDNAPIALNSVEDSIIISVTIGQPVVKADIDLKNNKFDFSYQELSSLQIQFKGTLEGNIQFSKNFKDAIDKFNKSKTINSSEHERGDKVAILNIPCPLGVPCVYGFFKVEIEPKIDLSGSITCAYTKYWFVNSGVTLVKSKNDFESTGLTAEKMKEQADEYGAKEYKDKFSIKFEGSLLAEASINVEGGLKISILPPEVAKEYDDTKKGWIGFINKIKKAIKDVSEVGSASVYGKLGAFFELNGSISETLIFGKEPVLTKRDETVGEWNLGLGSVHDVGANLNINLLGIIKKDTKISFLPEEYRKLYWWKLPKSTESETEDKKDISIPEIGETFNLEGIKFLVLDKKNEGNRAKSLIITYQAFDCVPFNIEGNDNGSVQRSWSTSSVKDYLNTYFYDTYLKKYRIDKVKVETKDKSFSIATADQYDYVFLLSADECNHYFPSDKKSQPSSRAINNGATVDNGNTKWWLRDRGTAFDFYYAFVDTDGTIKESGANQYEDDICIRPAAWIYTIETSKKYENITQGTYLIEGDYCKINGNSYRIPKG